MANLRKALALGLLNAAGKGLGSVSDTIMDKQKSEAEIKMRQQLAKEELTGSQKDYQYYNTLSPEERNNFLKIKSAGALGATGAGNVYRETPPPTPHRETDQERYTRLLQKQAMGQALTKEEQGFVDAIDAQ